MAIEGPAKPGAPAELAQATIGLVSVSDRASAGFYPDQGLPALKQWLQAALLNPVTWHECLIADEQEIISQTLRDLVDERHCDLVLTTGGTGPAARDITPEATLAVAERVLPGFGEQMRQISLRFVPTAILSRQLAATRARSLIINLPGQPKAIAQTLGGLPAQNVPGIFAAVPYCIDLLGGVALQTRPEICAAFRPPGAAPATASHR